MIATKEQERKTLEKIKQMVAELGENSYLDAAFNGVFGLAEQNIENDWALSAQEYIDQAINANSKVKELESESASSKAHIERLIEENKTLSAQYNDEFKRAETNAKLIIQCDADKRQLTAEVINLKARLYDYMIQTA